MNILLVEDDAGIGRFVQRGLVAEGYQVEWQRSGGVTAARLATGAFAAAILDLTLPDVDGSELCRQLRDARIDTPICMVTARSSLEEKLEGFRCGADDYLPKPFAFEELLARIAVLVRRGEASRRNIVSAGALHIDMDARLVRIGPEPLNLSAREYDVLRCLAQSRGAVMTRSQLLDGAWGAEADVTENVVDVYIGYLRRRLAGFPRAVKIVTVRGTGFRLDS